MRILTLVSLLCLTVVAAVFGQSTDVPAPLDYRPIFDGVVVAVLPVLVHYVRQALPKLPRALIWTLPIVFGSVTTMIAQALGSGVSGWRGMILGGLAIALREAVSTIKEHGLTGKGA
mgnify:FL=1